MIPYLSACGAYQRTSGLPQVQGLYDLGAEKSIGSRERVLKSAWQGRMQEMLDRGIRVADEQRPAQPFEVWTMVAVLLLAVLQFNKASDV